MSTKLIQSLSVAALIAAAALFTTPAAMAEVWVADEGLWDGKIGSMECTDKAMDGKEWVFDGQEQDGQIVAVLLYAGEVQVSDARIRSVRYENGVVGFFGHRMSMFTFGRIPNSCKDAKALVEYFLNAGNIIMMDE